VGVLVAWLCAGWGGDQLLGGSVNDFYFELAVRVVEVCGQTREENHVYEWVGRWLRRRAVGMSSCIYITYRNIDIHDHTIYPLKSR
jgi:hypothetical protein